MSNNSNTVKRLLRLPAVKELTGFSRSSIYLKMSQGCFPTQISLGARTVGWLESEIADWIDQQINKTRKIKI